MSAALAYQPSVAELIAAERAAHRHFDAICKATDSVLLGREATDEEGEIWEGASDAHRSALVAVVFSAPANPAELAAIIDLFLEREDPSCIEHYLLVKLFDTVKAYVARKPSKRPCADICRQRDEAALRAGRAEQAVRTAEFELHRLRHRLECAENRLASMGVRL